MAARIRINKKPATTPTTIAGVLMSLLSSSPTDLTPTTPTHGRIGIHSCLHGACIAQNSRASINVAKIRSRVRKLGIAGKTNVSTTASVGAAIPRLSRQESLADPSSGSLQASTRAGPRSTVLRSSLVMTMLKSDRANDGIVSNGDLFHAHFAQCSSPRPRLLHIG
jgi:hypothetical protein